MIEMIDVSKSSVSELKAAANRLRTEYAKWKKENPNQQNEEYINYFLLIKSALEEKGQILPSKDEILDIEANSLAKISVIPAVPGSYTFDDFAPIGSSGDGDNKIIKLDDLESKFKDFLIADPMVWLVGGIVTHLKEGTKNDVDILVSIPTKEELQRIILFRLYRMFPEGMRDRLHFLVEKKAGPFTDFLSLYRLKLERIPDAEIMKMGDLFAEISLRAKVGSQIVAQANKAAKDDKITFGEFFLPQKPTRGYVPDQAQTVEYFLSLWKDEQFPLYSSRKADGINTEWHISKSGEITVFTEDGVDETDSFPETIEEAKKIAPGRNVIFLAETEWWGGKQHFPREVAAGNVHKKHPNEVGIIVNVYDMVFFDKDIHKLPLSDRWKMMEGLKFPQISELPDVKHKWNLIPHIECKDEEELKRETERLKKSNGSEGNVAKQSSASYDLTGSRPQVWIKHHNSSIFVAILLDSIETKTKGVYNLQWAILAGDRKIKAKDKRVIDDKVYVYGGKTFSTALEKLPTKGSGISIECETFNVTYDKRDGAFDISAWAPRFMGISEKKPQTIEEVEDQAIKDHVFQAKLIDEEGKVHYLPGASGEEIESK